MDLALSKKTAFVSGSTRGIGLAIASRLLEEGARVVITGRDAERVKLTALRFREQHGQERVLDFVGDLTITAVAAAAVDATRHAFGKIDILVANVGTGNAPNDLVVGEDAWRTAFDANLWAAVRLTELVVPDLQNGNAGVVLFIASITGVESTSAPLPYGAAKAALINYAANLSRRLGPSRVRVNSLAAGNVLVPGGRWADRQARDPAGVAKLLESEVPLRRFGTPDEIADVAAFLVSDRAAFVTGTCITVDGGQTRSV